MLQLLVCNLAYWIKLIIFLFIVLFKKGFGAFADYVAIDEKLVFPVPKADPKVS